MGIMRSLLGWAGGSGMRADSSSDRSPFGNFWFEPLGMKSMAGVRVTAGTARRLSAVYACVRIIAESFAVLPFRMYKVQSNGGRTLVTDHWLVRLMRRPNPYQTCFEWTEMIQGHLALRGNAFNQMFPDGQGGIGSLMPIHPDRIKVVPAGNNDYAYEVTRADGSKYVLNREEVWHLRGLSDDGVMGLNPIEVTADVLGVAIAGQGFISRFFANDARPGGWIEYDGKFADNKAKQAFREGWQKLQTGPNRGKTAVLDKGMKYNQLQVNNADAQFLEMMKHTRSEIAGMFRVPPHMIGDLERATFSNIEQQSMDFVNGCIMPWSERWESSIETHLLLDDEAAQYEVEFDFARLLRGDMAARSAFYTAMINNGSMTRNQARIAEGWNPMPGLDVPLVMTNMTTADKVGQTPTAPALPAPGKTEPKEPPPQTPPPPKKKSAEERHEARVAAMARAATERLARREAKELLPLVREGRVEEVQVALCKHAAVIQAALGVTSDATNAYVTARLSDPIRVGHEEEDIYAAAFAKLEQLAMKGEL